jgi:putative Mg2+ transporter-C (MgtC) family protein
MAGPHFSWLELVIRLGSALVFGSVIGAERQWRQRTAGLRTYSLVSGLTVHGLNTASTIWCSAAIGVLSGSGFFAAAFVGTLFVLIINIFLRSLADWIGRHAKKETAELTIEYSIQLICRGRQESRVRTLLIQLLTLSPLTLHEVESVVGQDDKNTVIKAIVSAAERNDAQVEQVTSRLSLERDVVGISWQALPVGRTE